MSNKIKDIIINNQFIPVIFILLVGWVLLEIKDILIGIFISYVISVALVPFVSFLKSKKISNTIAAVLTYFLFLLLLIIIVFPLIPFFISQMQSLINSFPDYLNKASQVLGIEFDFTKLGDLFKSEWNTLGRSVFEITGKVFGGIFSVITIFVISFYMLLDHKKIKEFIAGIFSNSDKAFDILNQLEEKLGAWLRGQIALSLIIGFLTWIILVIIGLEFALPLAILAGLLEIVPTVGPILSAIPAVIIALNDSTNTALITIIAYVIIQALENNIVVPRVMEKAVGLNPVVIILGVMIGGRLLGIIGALLSVPLISLAVLIYKNIRNK